MAADATGTPAHAPAQSKLEEEDSRELASALRVRLLRDTTRGKTAGYLSGLFQLRLRGNPQGGRFDPVRIQELPTRPYDSAPTDQRWRLRVGDVVLKLNDRRITSFRTLDAILDYIKKECRALEVHISATRRGEAAAATPRRIRNASLNHHAQNFLVQALANVYKRPCVTSEERRLAFAAGLLWSTGRSCCTLFALGPGGWYDTLEVRIRKVFSVHAPRQHYLDGAGVGATADGGGARRRNGPQPLAFGAPGIAASAGGHEGHLYGVQGMQVQPHSRHKRLSAVGQQPFLKMDAQAVGGGYGGPPPGTGMRGVMRQTSGEASSPLGGAAGQLGGALRLGAEALWLEREAMWLELSSAKGGCRHETAAIPLNGTGLSSVFAIDLREDILIPVLPFGDTLKVSRALLHRTHPSLCSPLTPHTRAHGLMTRIASRRHLNCSLHR